jgi:hypothetical protein
MGGYAAQGLIKRGLGFAVQRGLLSAGRVGVARFGASVLVDTAIGTGLSMGFHGESFGQALPGNITGAFLGSAADIAFAAGRSVFRHIRRTSNVRRVGVAAEGVVEVPMSTLNPIHPVPRRGVPQGNIEAIARNISENGYDLSTSHRTLNE